MSGEDVSDKSREILSLSEIPLFPDDDAKIQFYPSDWKLLFPIALLLVPVTYLGLKIPSFPAFLFETFGSLFLPPVLFVAYWGAIYGMKIRERICLHFTLVQAIAVGAFSLLLYYENWNFSTEYLSADTVHSWFWCNVICVTVISWVVMKTYKVPSTRWLILSSFLIFVWVLTYAFPWSGQWR